MKVRAKKVEYIEVDVEEKEIKDICINRFKKAANLPVNYDSYRIEDGVLYGDYEAHTSHSYIVTERIRESTVADVHALDFLKALYAP